MRKCSQGGTYIQGASILQRREYPRESSEVIMPTGDHIGNRDPLKEKGIKVRVAGHPIEAGIPIGMEGLLEEEDILEEAT